MIISSSFGNDSIALIQWAYENKLDCTVVYIDTGWSGGGWESRIEDGEQFAKHCGFEFARIKPEVQFEELMQMKKGFPNQRFQWCSGLLKGIPFLNWIDEIDPDCKEVVMVGKRRSESRERAKTPEFIESSDYHGGRKLWHPLYKHGDLERDALLERAGFEPLPHRSLECHPCVNANRDDFKLLNPLDVERVAKLESIVGKTMFRPARHNGAIGIVNVVEWAKRGKYIEGQEDMFDSGCGGFYGCGL